MWQECIIQTTENKHNQAHKTMGTKISSSTFLTRCILQSDVRRLDDAAVSQFREIRAVVRLLPCYYTKKTWIRARGKLKLPSYISYSLHHVLFISFQTISLNESSGGFYLEKKCRKILQNIWIHVEVRSIGKWMLFSYINLNHVLSLKQKRHIQCLLTGPLETYKQACPMF